MVKNIITYIGFVAATIAIGTIGWKLAVYYYKLDEMANTTYTAALLKEKTLENDSLKDKNNQLNIQLTAAKNIPTDKDWDITNNRCLAMYSDIVRCVYEMQTTSNSLLNSITVLEPKSKRFMDIISTMVYTDDKGQYDLAQIEHNTRILKENTKELQETTGQYLDMVKNIGQIYKTLNEILTMQKLQFRNIMLGAGLVTTVNEDNQSYVVLTKYPKYGTNWITGELKDFGQTTKPSK